ncbi:N-acetylglucosamine-1-phosphotransferase subunits alpha/beta-like [Mercenaria mercenaria]|uniref:N-acetylglucosamine-1-phosphotransferase subunits alpha/beta-like n=1 Tax=Mercenaria mercenaria TaxID=6596 RepID=UPI00234E378E|nr:N-acetylglucosamine-1-phosphotransferase subunits alpha/beta-like [Mercenaria mercenaria]
MGSYRGIISNKQLKCFIKLMTTCVILFYLWNIYSKCTCSVGKRMYQTGKSFDIRPEDVSVTDVNGYSDIQGVSGPVDLVVTWVNGSDQSFIDEMSRLNISRHKHFTLKRYRDWGILRYALRSVEKYANWFRHVYIVTNGQVPSWLNLKYHRVSIVQHSDIFKNKSHLPTFNSLAIEAHIHRIPGLSKHFVYMNDDFFFLNKVELDDFYTNETGFKLRFNEMKISECSKKCTYPSLNNGICDTECNKSKCDWDGGDCNISGSNTRQSFDNILNRLPPFSGAVVYTMLIYNKEFGSVYGKIPAHVPYIIDKTLMNELQNRLPEEWDRTSASKIRTQHCFLYAFAYYHYLMRHQRRKPGDITIATTIENHDDYSYSATGNATGLDNALRILLRNKKKKFGCINDHMTLDNKEEEARAQPVLDNFFRRLFPKPSRFEVT